MARSHQRLATYLGARPDTAAEAPEHVLAAVAIYVRLIGALSAFSPQPRVQKTIALVQFCLARRPANLPTSISELAATLRAECGVDLEQFLATTERTPMQLGPSGELIMSMGPEQPLYGGTRWTTFSPLPGDRRYPKRCAIPRPTRALAGDRRPCGDARSRPTAPSHIADLCDDLIATGWTELAEAIMGIALGDRGAHGDVCSRGPGATGSWATAGGDRGRR